MITIELTLDFYDAHDADKLLGHLMGDDGDIRVAIERLIEERLGLPVHGDKLTVDLAESVEELTKQVEFHVKAQDGAEAMRRALELRS